MLLATLRFLNIVFFRFLGKCCYYIFKKRRKIALSNVKKCSAFLEQNGVKINSRKIVKGSFVNLGHTLGDFVFFRWYTKKNIDRYVKVRNVEYLEQALGRNKGVVLATAHFGSWELAAHMLALKGYRGLIVYNKFKKPVWLDDVVKKQRERSGNTLILKQNSFLKLYKQLKQGGLVVLLTDQHAVPPEGEQISFLGQDAWTHTAYAKMSIKTGATVVPAFIFRHGLFRHVVEFSKPIDPNDFTHETNQASAMAKKYNKALEAAIIRAPHLWMWQHRRFKKHKDCSDSR